MLAHIILCRRVTLFAAVAPDTANRTFNMCLSVRLSVDLNEKAPSSVMGTYCNYRLSGVTAPSPSKADPSHSI